MLWFVWIWIQLIVAKLNVFFWVVSPTSNAKQRNLTSQPSRNFVNVGILSDVQVCYVNRLYDAFDDNRPACYLFPQDDFM